MHTSKIILCKGETLILESETRILDQNLTLSSCVTFLIHSTFPTLIFSYLSSETSTAFSTHLVGYHTDK